jgi:hypothetical protein
MSDRDQDETLAPNEFEPGEEEFEDQPEDSLEGEDESEEPGAAETGRGAGEPSHRRFGFTLGAHDDEEGRHRPSGSVRESHERVHIDDRASAVYAILVSVALLGLLVIAVLGNFVPQAAPAPLPTLNVPTFQATPSPLAGASASASLAPSGAPTASPSAAPSAS